MRSRSRARLGTVLATALAFVLAVGVAPAGAKKDPFKTGADPMLAPTAPGVTVDPLITVGETVDGYLFEGIPDGIVVQKGKKDTADVWVNHENSLVPFPATQNNFTNAILSHLVLSRKTGGVLSGDYAIPSSANYQRFCSNFLAGKEHGFERALLFTNEEASDTVNRTGTAWPLSAGSDPEQAGVVVAYDVETGDFRSIYSMGRHNHENAVALKGYKHPAVLSGDDTFNAPSSQLYLYTAGDADQVWNDGGTLWAFRSDAPGINDYGDLSGAMSVSGEFIEVPHSVAIGDQTGLETWSNANNVFQFIRVEDLAYDRKHSNVVYFADTGEPRAIADPATGRLKRGPSGTMGPYPNGRIFKIVLDKKDPTQVDSLSILIDGEPFGAASAGMVGLLHNPDNLETTKKSLLIQEDPGSQNQYPASNPAGTTARIWLYDLKKGTLTEIARVDQSATPASNQGAWESSGIVDASKAFGKDMFLVDVQAHTLTVASAPSPVTGVMHVREGGQLLLIHIPHS